MLDKFVTQREALPKISSKARRVLRDHCTFLCQHPTTTTHLILASKGYEEQHNWYRYFAVNRIDHQLYYPIMLMNNISSLLELDENVKSILLPDIATVTDILSRALD